MKSLYVHVPFCNSICYYCDFKRTLFQKESASLWLARIKKDIHELTGCFDTIYLGGGTPSALSHEQLKELLNVLSKYCSHVKEFTMESNLESLDEIKLRIMKKAGVNRISLGVQSLETHLLKEMNRKHQRKDVYDVLEMIHQEGFHNISIDLIYGFENQSMKEWESNLHEMASHPYVTHISLYSLTIEEGSVFGKQHRQTCDNELEAMMYEKAIEILNQHGYKQYEIANFAKEGYESLHNMTYWRYDDFVGVGLGASGKNGCVRYSYEGSLSDYIHHKEIKKEEYLTKEDMMFENIMMSLRMRKGMCISEFNRRYACDFISYYHDAIVKEVSNKHLIIEDDYVKVTRSGMFLLHDVLLSFMM